MRKELNIIVLGNNHADFTPYSVLIRMFERLHKVQIPYAFLQEGPGDVTLKVAFESTARAIQSNQMVKSLLPQIKKFYIKDKNSSYSYLTKAAWGPIEESMAKQLKSFLGDNKGLLVNTVLDLYRDNAYHEQIKLYENMILRNVPYAGIEAETATYNQQMISNASSNDQYKQNELTRINTMVDNVFKESLKFTEGGIVFVFTGNNHVHRLAANLLQRSKSSNYDLSRYNLKIHSYRLYSSYVKDWVTDHLDALDFTVSLDSQAIREIYESHPCPQICCKEDNGLFSYEELEFKIDELIKQRSQASTPSVQSHSIFTPLSAHDQLVRSIKEYCTSNPEKVSQSFIKTIEINKNYSLALRNACSWGNYALTKLLLKFSNDLPFDFKQTSTNGNTPLTWFEESSASMEEKQEITALLLAEMTKIMQI